MKVWEEGEVLGIQVLSSVCVSGSSETFSVILVPGLQFTTLSTCIFQSPADDSGIQVGPILTATTAMECKSSTGPEDRSMFF